LTLNPIFVLSVFRYKVRQSIQRRILPDAFLEFEEKICYPPQVKRAQELYERLFPQLLLLEKSYCFKNELRKLGRRELWGVYKFYNLVHEARATRFCLHEILRRNLLARSILLPFGVSRYFLSMILANFIVSNGSASCFHMRLILKFVYFCNKYSLDNPVSEGFIRKNSRIAVVGGAPAPAKNDTEISEFDYVAVLSLSGDFAQDCQRILYIRGEKGDHIFRKFDKAVFTDFRFVIVKLFRHYKIMFGVPELRGKFNSSAFLDYSLDFGKLNAVPTMCFDLVTHKPTLIKVFNTDLNLSKQHRHGYRDDTLPSVQFGHIFGEHPAAVQFLFLKALHKYFDVNFETNVHFSINWSYRRFLRQFYRSYGELKNEY
jgi:hypothetical protein